MSTVQVLEKKLMKLINVLTKDVAGLKESIGSIPIHISLPTEPVINEVKVDPKDKDTKNWKKLTDGTWQWIGGVDPNTPNKVPNVPLPIPAGFGKGAVVLWTSRPGKTYVVLYQHEGMLALAEESNPTVEVGGEVIQNLVLITPAA